MEVDIDTDKCHLQTPSGPSKVTNGECARFISLCGKGAKRFTICNAVQPVAAMAKSLKHPVTL